jgi:hypothetical protein
MMDEKMLLIRLDACRPALRKGLPLPRIPAEALLAYLPTSRDVQSKVGALLDLGLRESVKPSTSFDRLLSACVAEALAGLPEAAGAAQALFAELVLSTPVFPPYGNGRANRHAKEMLDAGACARWDRSMDAFNDSLASFLTRTHSAGLLQHAIVKFGPGLLDATTAESPLGIALVSDDEPMTRCIAAAGIDLERPIDALSKTGKAFRMKPVPLAITEGAYFSLGALVRAGASVSDLDLECLVDRGMAAAACELPAERFLGAPAVLRRMIDGCYYGKPNDGELSKDLGVEWERDIARLAERLVCVGYEPVADDLDRIVRHQALRTCLVLMEHGVDLSKQADRARPPISALLKAARARRQAVSTALQARP